MAERSHSVDAQLRDLQERWMAAWIAQDRATLEEILAPEFALIISARPSDVIPRPVWLDTAVGGYACTAFEYRDMIVRDFGGFAVVSSVAVQQATAFGADRSGAFFLTDVWQRTGDGRWQVVARYSSHPEPVSASVTALPSESRRAAG